MSLRFTRFGIGILCAVLAGACGDDSSPKKSEGETPDGGGEEQDLFLIGSTVATTEESALLLWTSPELTPASLDPADAMEVVGGGEAFSIDGKIYVSSGENQSITRYEVQAGALVAGPTVSFADRGLGQYFSYTKIYRDAEHAYYVNDVTLKIIEWNPSTMLITKEHDIGALAREGWGQEYRGGFVRKSDGKFFFMWTYTNQRTEFINTFVLGVFDTNTGALTIQEDQSCPASAGFGGYFDEQEDLYLIADSFGGFTRFGGFADVKDECILRVKKGESVLDSTFKLVAPPVLGGRSPWGLYYLGNGQAFVSAIDPALLTQYPSVFELLFAPAHSGWLIDVPGQTAREITNLPKDGVGFAAHRVDGRLLVARTTGEVVIEDIMSLQSTLFEIKADATAVATFSLPGYIDPVERVR